MISAKINNVSVNVSSQVIAEHNRRETADYGSFKVLNDREERYEPFSIVDLNYDGDDYQYIIESDQPLLLKSGLYEHELTLTECMMKLDSIYPANRSFTTLPSKTLREILQIYKTELEYYHGFYLDFDESDSIYDAKMPYKEYPNASMATIVYNLFKRIDAIPRLRFNWANEVWELTYELYTETNNEVTLGVNARQSQVNDVDYATEILARTRNGISEDIAGVWVPSKTGTITPRIKGEMFLTSDLQYQFDFGILEIIKAICPVDVTIGYYVGETWTTKTLTVDVDFTQAVLTNDDWLAQKNYSYNGVIRNPLYDTYFPGKNDPIFYKQNTISYTIGNNTIDNLFSVANGLLGFTVDINNLRNAIWQFVIPSLWEQYPDELPDGWFYGDGTSIDWTIPLATEDIECRFYYRPQKDIDLIVERNLMGNINKSTMSTSQSGKYVEMAQYIENVNAIANRIGTEVKGISQYFETGETYWKLGDYSGDWVIIDIRYTFDKTGVVCLADFAKDFSNTMREYNVAKEPGAFAFSGKRLTSNFIIRKYLQFYSGDNAKIESDYFTAKAKRIATNLLDFAEEYNTPLFNANVIPSPKPAAYGSDKAANAPVSRNGGANLVAIHFGFDDPRIVGHGMIKVDELLQGTYGWYKNPLYYVDEDDFSLKYILFTLANSMTPLVDTDTEKYYPLVEKEAGEYTSRLQIPVDKNIDDALGVTVELIPYSDEEDIIIGSAFSKYNNLIYEFETLPELELYSSAKKYTIFDKKIRTGDVLQTSGFSIAGNKITIPELDHWALAYNDEIVLAANNGITEVSFKFLDKRYDLKMVAGEADLAFNIGLYSIISGHRISNAKVVFGDNVFMEIESHKVTLYYVSLPKFNQKFICNIISTKVALFKKSIIENSIIDLTITAGKIKIFHGASDESMTSTLTLSGTLLTQAWIETTLAAYTAASSKSTIMEDTTSFTLPSRSSYSADHVLRIMVYNLESVAQSIYDAASYKVDLTVGDTDPTGEEVEDAMQSQQTPYWNDFSDGTLPYPNDTVFRVDDGVGYTYWRPIYPTSYYLAGFEE